MHTLLSTYSMKDDCIFFLLKYSIIFSMILLISYPCTGLKTSSYTLVSFWISKLPVFPSYAWI